ncbi:MAG: nickel pincer cofactor biosynthesis protein LarC [Clostridiales bacterium]|nr:nickel pincer cofactor biosynthesis protein LarC [Clostridiales bacterium]
MKIAYFDCPTGISGDMTVAALLDAGACREELEYILRQLPLAGWQMQISRVDKQGLAAMKVDFICPEENDHRHLGDIRKLILAAGLPLPVEEFAVNAFEDLARAEAAVHGCPVDDIHFHEVGAMDAILDITAAAAALHLLAIEQVYASPLPLGSGFVNCAHGCLPAPAPAVLRLLEDMPVRPDPPGVSGELVTPTGAAILGRALGKNKGCQPGHFTLKNCGFGAGKRDLPVPNLLRVLIGEEGQEEAQVELMQTWIDDASPELLADFSPKALEAGALDVALSPLLMKKGRLGAELTVLVPAGESGRFAQLIFAATTASGLRIIPARRLTLSRCSREVDTAYGPVSVKINGQGADATIAPEYESCRQAAKAADVPLKAVYQAAISAYLSRR